MTKPTKTPSVVPHSASPYDGNILTQKLGPIRSREETLRALIDLPPTPKQVPGAASATATTRCQVSHQGRSLEFGLGTVAGMKGETHAASLVLESYGGNSKKFDVALGLEYIAGLASKKLEKLPKTQQAQMRNLYVAMSRPTTLLCLAANESRVSQTLRDALATKGWDIEIVT
jgi:DNA helicase-2/ATP-dependent DNA helicase PcrA